MHHLQPFRGGVVTKCEPVVVVERAIVIQTLGLALWQVVRVAFLRDAKDEEIHEDDLEYDLDQVQCLNDRVQEALLMVDELLVEEADERLNGRQLIVNHVLRLVDGSEQLNGLRLLVLLTDVGH